MRKIGLGLFNKIFLYTLLFLALVIGVFTFFYAQQLQVTFSLNERRQLTQNFQPLLRALEQTSIENIAEAASSFRERNETFEFSIQSNYGDVIYETADFQYNPVHLQDLPPMGRIFLNEVSFSIPLTPELNLHIANVATRGNPYIDELYKMMPLSLVLLAASVVCAYIFAKLIARPINKLAKETTKMSRLENVPFPSIRKDEIGKLTQDVHSMYERLKQTISELEKEIEHKKKIEESQRYFFSAASHELKTPIAGTTAIIEALIEKIIEPEEYPNYFNQCLVMMKTQTKLISEIIEIVRFNDGKANPIPEKINLANIIENLIPAYEMLILRKNQTLDINIPTTENIFADKKMLNRVFSNVIMNAITNTPEQSEIRIWCENGRLCILNTNTKISDDELPKLFDPFYRIDKSRSSSQGRSGLGLTIVKKNLEAMEIPFGLENTKEGVLFWLGIN
ncbi:MAG: HAMP domain-containing histidine kinase [Oscillospiraceae bacterium]|nr:HAMP domain-containing histidine kinase [Oscillospiraceae bacterium]